MAISYKTVFLGIALLAMALRLPFLDFVQIWDGYTYFTDCLKKAYATGIDVSELNCFGHPSAAYTLLFALPFNLFGLNEFVVNTVNLLLLIGAAVAFTDFYRKYLIRFDTPPTPLETLLVGLAFVANPFFQANTLLLNVDIGIFFFQALFLNFLFSDRLRLAAFAGLGLLFSKETGAVVFALTLALWLYKTQAPKDFFKKAFAVAWAPFSTLLLYFVFRALDSENLVWSGVLVSSGRNQSALQAAFDFTDGSSLSFYTWIFVANFHWLFTAVCLFAISKSTKKSKNVWMPIVLYTVFLALILTRIKVFNNSRYFLPAQSALLLSYALCLREIFKTESGKLRFLTLGVVTSLVSCFFTVDPLSKKAYGTFHFGKNQLLNATSISDECCGHGRDQLVYNLQFSYYSSLQSQLYEKIKPTPETVVLLHPIADWHTNSPLRTNSFSRTLAEKSSFHPKYGNLADLQEFGGQWKVDEFVLLVIPMVPQADMNYALSALSKFFEFSRLEKVEKNGYLMQAVYFKRRVGVPTP